MKWVAWLGVYAPINMQPTQTTMQWQEKQNNMASSSVWPHIAENGPMNLLKYIFHRVKRTLTKVMVVDKGVVCRQHPYKREQRADRKCSRPRVRGTTLQPQGKEPGQRATTKNHGRLGDIRQTPWYLQKQPCYPYNSCVLPAMTYGAETETLTKQAQNKMERSMLKLTYMDRKNNICMG